MEWIDVLLVNITTSFCFVLDAELGAKIIDQMGRSVSFSV